MLNLICRALVMLIVIPFHESAHALVSWKLGDDTAKRMGRLSLNPLHHLDPMGALCMIVAGVGWAKPVPTAAYRFRDPKKGMALTALAGPVSNFLLAIVSMILYKMVVYATVPFGTDGTLLVSFVTMFLYYMIIMNVSLGVFNLIPIPPFDGSRVLLTFLPQKYYFKIMQYEHYIFIGLFVILMLGFLDGPLGFLNLQTMRLLDGATRFVDQIAYAILY